MNSLDEKSLHSWHQLASSLEKLVAILSRLISRAEELGIAAPRETTWWKLLHEKLLPQLGEKQLLIVAILGGTNTGKSLLFNLLAGEEISAVDHRAAGTKNPVCVVSPELGDNANIKKILARHFDSFALVALDDAEAPLKSDCPRSLFWRSCAVASEKLILIDTPDIDSHNTENWERAATVRQSADVVIAVLTPEKYNDAAVRRFFQQTAAAGKGVIIIFNQVAWESDCPHLQTWYEHFCRETNIAPLAVLAIPFCKERAESRTLKIFSKKENLWCEEINLRQYLASLHFDQLKTRSFLGAIQFLTNSETGVPSYLQKLREAASEARAAKVRLAELREETTTVWPTIPTSFLRREVEAWWRERRPVWSQRIHAVYGKIGKFITQIPRVFARPEMELSAEPMTLFRRAEEVAVTQVVERTLERLQKFTADKNPVLRREVSALLTGDFRSRLIDESQTAHAALPPMNDDFRTFLRNELEVWAQTHSDALKQREFLDSAMAVAHPVMTVALLVTGGAGAAFLLSMPFLSVAGLAGAGAGGILGEAAIHKSSEHAAQHFSQIFRNAMQESARQRATHFYEWFNKKLWGEILARLDRAAQLPSHSDFLSAAATLRELICNHPEHS